MLITEDFVCERDEKEIRGQCWCDEEKADAVLPPVILCHGLGSNMNYMEPYARFFASAGYRAFTFDFIGGGHQTVSGGTMADDMTPITETEDLRTVISYVRSRNDVQMEKLILSGGSQGGFVCAVVSAQDPSLTCSLVLLYPAFCIPDYVRKGTLPEIEFDPENIPDHLGEGRNTLSGDYARSVIDMDVFKVIEAYKGRVLIIHGSDDSLVPLDYSQKAFETYQAHGADVTMHIIDGGVHGFEGTVLMEAYDVIRQWLGQ